MLQSLSKIFNDAYSHSRADHPEHLARSLELYLGSVRPSAGLAAAYRATFGDWYLFDTRMGGGRSPLLAYAETMPNGPCREDALSIAETGVFSSFSYDNLRRDGLAVITDLGTGAARAVEGSQLADVPAWMGSVVTGRIAMAADGTWHAVSPMFYRDRAEPRVARRVAADIRRGTREGEALSLAFAREVLGAEGGFSHTARVNGRPAA